MMQKSPPLDAQLIILGGGCAGLSLAARLAEQQPDLRLIVVEPRIRYDEDRTWCGWRMAPHFFSDCVVAQWKTWRIVSPGASLELCSSAYPYELIRSNLFYEKASRCIETSHGTQILAGAEAVKVVDEEDFVTVSLADGRCLGTSWVVDTRPVIRKLHQPWLWQNFVGYVVSITGASPIPDAIPTLMEFQPSGGAVAQFMYTIPLGDGSVLFECTRFSQVHGEEQALEEELCCWLRARFGDQWSVLRREAGSLPMAPPVANSQRRVIHAGTRGGSMRISTGYAFHRIQRWADACAASVMRDGAPVAPQGSSLLDAMDELFLRVLQNPSVSAGHLFGDLFASCPTDRLIRFLSGIPRASDLWPVARGLPWGKFLREAPKLAGSLRSRYEGVA
jgi:lycopene beta-cyclase